ncbi:Clavaminate synthase-like protein [Mycena floridula]|nr:Clavaminate synthase-like protein [Mycena floridula]
MPSSPTAGPNLAIIDFEPFLDGSNKQQVADSVLDAFKCLGFLYLTNHGILQSQLDQMFDWSKRFFALPEEIKQLAPHPASGTHHRGYSAPGLEKVSQHVYLESELKEHRAKAPDAKESFESGREDDSGMPNIWLPDGVFPGFKEACLDFFSTCFELEKSILKALALGFKLPEDYFVKCHTRPDNQLRLLHYPSVPIEALDNDKIALIGAHSDFASITLLFQDDIGGLEVEDPMNPGTFQSVSPVPGAVVVNAGDFLMRWSNDIIRSTIHRVRAPPNLSPETTMTPERYSIPYFCAADFDTVVECVPGTWSAENPKKYEPISAREYLMKRLAASY